MSRTSGTEPNTTNETPQTQTPPAQEPGGFVEMLRGDIETLPFGARAAALARLRERGLLDETNVRREPSAEPSAELAVEPSAEPSTEPSTEPAVEPSAEPAEQPPAADTSAAPSVPGSSPAPSSTIDVAAVEQLRRQISDLEERLRAAEARYSTLRGKYDAETAELRRQIVMLQTGMQQAATYAPGNRVGTTTDTGTSTSSVNASQSIKDYLRAKYGNDFDDTTVNFVSEAVELARAQALEEVQRRLTELRSVAINTQQQALEVQLDTRIPGWREIAQDPRFAAWLDEPDPFSGLIRRDVLSKAIQDGSVQRIVTVFDTYRRGQTAEGLVPPPAAVQAPYQPAVGQNGSVGASAGTAPPSRPRTTTAAVQAPRPRGSVAATPATGAVTVTPEMLEAYRRRAMRGQATDEEYRVLHEAILSGNFAR